MIIKYISSSVKDYNTLYNAYILSNALIMLATPRSRVASPGNLHT